MKLEELIKNVKEILHDGFVNGNEDLMDYYEWWNESSDGDEDDYFEEIVEEFVYMLGNNMNHDHPVAANMTYEFEDFCETHSTKNEDFKEFAAKSLSHSLDNPFNDTWGYIWEPITWALEQIGFDTSKLRSLDATVGQKLVLAFYINDNDGQLPWPYVYDCL